MVELPSSDDPATRRRLLRGLAAVMVVALLVPTLVAAVTYEPTDLRSGTVTEPAEAPTVVGIQGFHFQGQNATKKPARLLSITGDGEFDWQFRGQQKIDATWYYDVDPVGDGDILVSATRPGETIVARIDRATREVVWTERLPYVDTHDVDLLPNGNLLVAHMRNFEDGVSDDRILVYDREAGEVEWEWVVRNHYPNSTAGGFREDWTHVNDVDRVGDGLYLASLRNFDQAVVVNRSTKEIELKLGEDEAEEILNAQHNPDLLRAEDGTPTMLVADSHNDRVVEYERQCEGDPGVVAGDPEECEWERTWSVGAGQFNWPRDADRLPNGNTLVTDSLNHRVVEVTPQGRVVWEYYATWGPYDAERIGTGDGSNGPTMADLGVTGSYRLSNSAGLAPGGGGLTFHGWLVKVFAGTPLSGTAENLASTWAHYTPWITPVWMSGWDFAFLLLAALVALVWAGWETYYRRERIRSRVAGAWARVAR